MLPYLSVSKIGDRLTPINKNFLLIFYVIPTEFPEYFKILTGINEENVAVVDLLSDKFEKGYVYPGILSFKTSGNKDKQLPYYFLNLELEDVFREENNKMLKIYGKNSIIYLELKEDLKNYMAYAKIYHQFPIKKFDRHTLNEIEKALYGSVKIRSHKK